MYALMMNTCCTDHWSLGHTPVSGGEGICIGGQRLRVICAPVIFIYMIASFEKHSFKLSSIAAPDMCTRFHVSGYHVKLSKPDINTN